MICVFHGTKGLLLDVYYFLAHNVYYFLAHKAFEQHEIAYMYMLQ